MISCEVVGGTVEWERCVGRLGWRARARAGGGRGAPGEAGSAAHLAYTSLKPHLRPTTHAQTPNPKIYTPNPETRTRKPSSAGMIEMWCGTSYGHPQPDTSSGQAVPRLAWSSKLDTDLFDLAKAKTVAKSLEVG